MLSMAVSSGFMLKTLKEQTKNTLPFFYAKVVAPNKHKVDDLEEEEDGDDVDEETLSVHTL